MAALPANFHSSNVFTSKNGLFSTNLLVGFKKITFSQEVVKSERGTFLSEDAVILNYGLELQVLCKALSILWFSLEFGKDNEEVQTIK